MSCYDAYHMSINKDQRKKLKILAHQLKFFINIGKEGLTDGAIQAINEKIEKDELIKIKFLQNKNKKKIISKEMSKRIQAEVVCFVGNIVTLFRKSKNPKNRQIKI